MIEQINWLSVAVAPVITFVVGGPWYSPALFLKPWQQDMNLSEEQPGHPVKVFGLAYVFSFVACAFLAFLLGPQRWLG